MDQPVRAHAERDRIAVASSLEEGRPPEAVRDSPISLRERIRHDLRQGRDVVITSYVGLWYEHSREPSRNLYWGALYGHDAMFRESRRAEMGRRLGFLQVTRYEVLFQARRDQDPIAVKVIGALSEGEPRHPGRGGRVIVVHLAYRDIERAVRDMGLHLKTGRVPDALSGEPVLASYMAASYTVGYWGHNVYYSGSSSDKLEEVPITAVDKPRGVFFVGCQSARWYPQKFLGPGIEPVMFTTTNMAPEAYAALALYDGMARGLAKEEIRRNVAKAYQVYQGLKRPPVSLFVNEPEQMERYVSPLQGVTRELSGP